MTTTTPQAFNAIETLLLAAQSGNTSIADLLDALLEAEVFILLDKDPQQDDGNENVLPLMLSNVHGKPVLAAFTAAERSIAMALEFPQFGFALPVALRKLLPTIRPGVGLVINPGTVMGLEMPAESVLRMQQDALLI